MFTQDAADNKLCLQHLLSTVRRCGGEVAPSTAPVQAAADTLMVSTEEGREVPCNSGVGGDDSSVGMCYTFELRATT